MKAWRDGDSSGDHSVNKPASRGSSHLLSTHLCGGACDYSPVPDGETEVEHGMISLNKPRL